MTVSLYDFSVVPLARGLTQLSAIIEKGAAHAAARKFDPSILAQARLFPDMHPLTRQVQIACDTAKGAAARLAAVEIPKHEDKEVSLDELRERIAKTAGFLQTIKPDSLAGAEERTIEIKFPNGAWKFSARNYITDFVLPNFYFHSSIVYALLRHNGVEIGKSDFLGAIQ